MKDSCGLTYRPIFSLKWWILSIKWGGGREAAIVLNVKHLRNHRRMQLGNIFLKNSGMKPADITKITVSSTTGLCLS